MLLRHRGRVQKGSVSALLSEGCEPFDKSGSGPTSLQIGLQTPHEHKQKEHSHAQNEDQEQREKTFPRSSRWHRQARSSLQTSHLDQEDHQEQAPPAWCSCCALDQHGLYRTNAAQCWPLITTNKEYIHASRQTWCNGPCPSQESSRPCQGLPWSPRQCLPYRQTGGNEGWAICLPGPPHQEARVPPAVD